MRHRKHTSKLNRTSEHRLALLRNLAVALLTHERIRTTQSKAQQLRPFVEQLVTMAKGGSLADRRRAIARLGDARLAHRLFEEIAPRVAERNGGYLRIVKDGPRQGDGALMAWIEFVDEAPVATDEDAPRPGFDRKKLMKKKLHERRKELAKQRKKAMA